MGLNDVGRIVWVLLCACPACGPTTAVVAEGTEGGSSAADGSSEVGTVDPSTSAGTTSSSSGTTTAPTTATTDDPSADTGPLGCPYTPCDVSEYCVLDSGECLPKPRTPMACAPDRVALAVDRLVDAAPGAIALGLADTDGVGARELVVVTDDGAVEIRSATLDPISTAALGFGVSNALVVGRAADGFGRIWARRADDGEMFVFVADGLGGFDPTPLGFIGGAMAAADLDDDDDTDLAVAVGDTLQLVTAGETIELGTAIELGGAARSVGATRGDDGVDLLVGTDTALLQLAGDGAGGFAEPTPLELVHPADVVGGFGSEFITGTFALAFGDGSPLSLASGGAEAWRWSLPDLAVGSAAAVAVYGDPGSTQDVLLLGGADRITVIVEPHHDQPCRADLEFDAIRAILPGGSMPIVATDGALARMSLQ